VSLVDLLPTVLDLAGAPPPALPGRSLAPLVRGERPAWRQYLFTEFHTHAAKTNFWPQRTVRDDRYKLIENLLPGEVNPGYAFTLDHHAADIRGAIARAPAAVRAAYARMERPPRWELYDLQADPYEYRDLAGEAVHAAALARLQRELAQWRQETADPLLQPGNLARLKAEIDRSSKQEARELSWNYPYYFFGQEPPPKDAAATGGAGKKKRKKQP
jgi:N-sulfoglucosamine sulfohydrolase